MDMQAVQAASEEGGEDSKNLVSKREVVLCVLLRTSQLYLNQVSGVCCHHMHAEVDAKAV
jgi:hypothetical protein